MGIVYLNVAVAVADLQDPLPHRQIHLFLEPGLQLVPGGDLIKARLSCIQIQLPVQSVQIV